LGWNGSEALIGVEDPSEYRFVEEALFNVAMLDIQMARMNEEEAAAAEAAEAAAEAAEAAETTARASQAAAAVAGRGGAGDGERDAEHGAEAGAEAAAAAGAVAGAAAAAGMGSTGSAEVVTVMPTPTPTPTPAERYREAEKALRELLTLADDAAWGAGGPGTLTSFDPGEVRRQLDFVVRPAVLRYDRGRAVQVDPIKPTLKAPGTKRLKLKYDKSLPNLLRFCFQIQLAPLHRGRLPPFLSTSSASSSSHDNKVGRCRLTLSKPRCNRLEVSS